MATSSVQPPDPEQQIQVPGAAEPMDPVKQAAISQKKVDRGYAMITLAAVLGVTRSGSRSRAGPTSCSPG